MRLKGKKVLVVGLGRSGRAAARFLAGEGAHVAVTDAKKEAELQESLNGLGDIKIEEFHLGTEEKGIFEKRDLICVSPGVSLKKPGLVWAHRKKIPIWGEMGLAAQFLKVPMIAVTGTNGKSTTSTLIWHLLVQAGRRAALAGNIGTPLLEIVMEKKKLDQVVVEVSSFQLETVHQFRPFVAVLLNVTDDHLDRYDSFKDYARAKMRIVRDQTRRDWVVYNQDDAVIGNYLRRAVAKRVPFSYERLLKSGIFFSGGQIVRRWDNSFENYPLGNKSLEGVHNIQNMMAAIAAVRICEVQPEAIRKGMTSFEGLPHRLQSVRDYRSVRYFDDSKGTNVGATLQSLAGFENGRVLLIAGGRDKGGRFDLLRKVVSQKVKHLLLIGEAAAKIEKALKGATQIHRVENLEKAVEAAQSLATAGDVVLLSPACASFDQFKNFEERGDRFQETVRRLGI